VKPTKPKDAQSSVFYLKQTNLTNKERLNLISIVVTCPPDCEAVEDKRKGQLPPTPAVIEETEEEKEASTAVAAAAAPEYKNNKYGSFVGVLTDPDLGITEDTLDKLIEAKDTLKDPLSMLIGNKSALKANKFG